MKCDICNENDAEIFMQQVLMGQRGEIHLCRECAHERGISIEGDRLEFSLAGFIAGLKAKALGAQQASDTRVCPVCGRS
jgi:protein-arginine kinase activator protein McsA